jgi:SMI1 / KNR4 family (SUKH-1)
MPSSVRPNKGGATIVQIDRCERAYGRAFPQVLRAWLSLFDGIWVPGGQQLFGTTDDKEDGSIDQYKTEHNEDFDWSTVVPIGADASGTTYALCTKATSSGHYPVIGRNFIGKEGGEHFVIASSLPMFIERYLRSSEDRDQFWPQICKSRAYRDDPELAEITEWPGPWTSQYKIVEPEPGSPEEKAWERMAKRGRALDRRKVARTKEKQPKKTRIRSEPRPKKKLIRKKKM